MRRKRRVPIFKRYMHNKLAATLVVVVLALFALCGVTVYYAMVKDDDYTIKVLNQQEYLSKTIPYKRGEIVDRNGNALATSIKVYNLVVDSKIILSEDKYLDATVSAIDTYFSGVDEDRINKDIFTQSDNIDTSKLVAGINERKGNSYWVVIEELEYDEIKAFQEYASDHKNIKGVWFEEEYKRMYPFDNLACSVIGFTNSDETADIGIESYYNDYLIGTNGREYGYVNSDSNMESVVKQPTNGDTVISTIDVNIQRIVQKKIKEYMKKFQPKRMAVVIADPNTGEILAMGDNTTYNLNDPRNLSAYFTESKIKSMSEKKLQEKLNLIWKNYCVSDSYEPGSTAKPFTVAAAYEEGLIDKKTSFVCDGGQQVGGFYIRCHKEAGHGTISAKQAIAYSCNDALMQIGAKLGPDLLTQYQTRFGFGFKTGIDLPGETRGIVFDAEKMVSSDIATNSFGQNFTVNMVQMVAGFSSLVNGGYYYEPHVVKEIRTADGNLVENFSKSIVRQTITEDTSKFIRESLRAVVTDGTGTNTAIPGYTIAGKTGTAEKVDTSGKGIGRIRGEYIISFLGCVPAENPKVVCYTLMDSPKEQPDSTAFNTEFWRAIMEEVLPYMHIEKTEDAGKDEDLKKTKKDDVAEHYSVGIIDESGDGSNEDSENGVGGAEENTDATEENADTQEDDGEGTEEGAGENSGGE
ncbi:MAG: penicillin-binding protein 2 [Lachnospiraceae bacterium]|nr:penicillin-binding protein 2 [Lachnospiraceae bacterium]